MPPRNLTRNAVRRKPRRIPHGGGRGPIRRKRTGWKARLAWLAFALAVVLLGWAAIARHLAPAGNTARTRFDAILVLGTPANGDGNPTPDQLARVTEAVHEYQRGIAPRLILTGGAAHNHFVEADVMAHSAEALGIPASAIFIEPEAWDTMQNACYSERIMKAHGWHSAEVVSSAAHLPRASLIFSRLPVEFTTHPAPPLEPQSVAYQKALAAVEVLKTARYLIWARWADRCEP